MFARFKTIRNIVSLAVSLLRKRKTRLQRDIFLSELDKSIFKNTDIDLHVSDLKKKGFSLGLNIPSYISEDVFEYANKTPAYADRKPNLGFYVGDHIAASKKLGKSILLAQYIGAYRDCKSIREIVNDPVLKLIASDYLGADPTYLGLALWWTFPGDSIQEEDRLKHAHYYHRDIDDFKFVKFFFYFTDVQSNDGAHWIVEGSHKKDPYIKFRDRFLIRRYSDREISDFYGHDALHEICGSVGTGIIEDTLCVHKASTPTKNPRLILHVQFGYFDTVKHIDETKSDDLMMIKL